MQIEDWDKLMSDTIISKQTDGIKEGEFDIIPCNTGVLIKFYDGNPYRTIERTESGLIFGIQSSQQQVTDEDGEVHENDEYVACAKVIAVGPKCQNVQPGEDVYVIKHIATPLPYRKQGFYTISEQNITCRVVPKTTNV